MSQLYKVACYECFFWGGVIFAPYFGELSWPSFAILVGTFTVGVLFDIASDLTRK